MSKSLIILALVFLPTLLAAAFLLSGSRRTAGHLQDRIGRIVLPTVAAEVPADRKSLQRSTISGLISWKRLIEHAQAALNGKPRPALLAALAGGATTALIAQVLSLSLLITMPAVAAVSFASAVALALRARARRKAKILASFPDALDLIVRALRAGLPLAEAFNSLATELPGPLAEEFRNLNGELSIGVPLDEAMRNASRRIGLPDFGFFTASIALQRETGGNLTETLQNLSQIIRRRKELQLKARALTSEARTSSLVIGALPFVASGALAIINPEYISKLVTDPRGVYLLAAAGTSMLCGVLVMRQLIRRSVG